MTGNITKHDWLAWVPIWVVSWILLNGLIWLAPFFPHAWVEWIRLGLSPVCHQLPEASCSINGVYLPVCCRCTAMYTGFLSGTILVWIAPNLPLLSPRWMIGAAILMGIDAGLNSLHLKSPDLAGRLLTGGGFGLLTGIVIFQRLKREVPHV